MRTYLLVLVALMIALPVDSFAQDSIANPANHAERLVALDGSHLLVLEALRDAETELRLGILSHTLVVDSLANDSIGSYLIALEGGREYTIVGWCERECGALSLSLHLKSDHERLANSISIAGFQVIPWSGISAADYELAAHLQACKLARCTFAIAVYQ